MGSPGRCRNASRPKPGLPPVNFISSAGVGGWAYPCLCDNKNHGAAGGESDAAFRRGRDGEMVLKNGVEFADYIAGSMCPARRRRRNSSNPANSAGSVKR